MRMDFLKVFCDLVDTGSFSMAADLNRISQPAVSQQLARLEQRFGTQLISRGGGLVVPTQAGQAFYRRAREIHGLYEQLDGEVRSAAEQIRGVLRIGSIYSVGFYLIYANIRQFHQAHPEVELRVEYTQWARIYAAVAGGEMDMGVVAYPESQRLIEVIPFTSEELVVACAPDHRLANAGHVEPAELEGEDFIAFERNIPTRRRIDQELARRGVRVNVAMQFDNIDTLKRAIEVGAGLSILPSGNVGREVADGRLARARFAKPETWVRPLGILRRRGQALTPAERKFLQLLRIRHPDL